MVSSIASQAEDERSEKTGATSGSTPTWVPLVILAVGTDLESRKKGLRVDLLDLGPPAEPKPLADQDH